MAAEAFVSVVSKELINKLLTSLAGHEITLFLGCKEDLKQLAAELTMMHITMHNPWIQWLIGAGSMDLWLARLETVLYEADDALDMLAFESLCRKVEMNKVHNLFLRYNPFAFRFKMARCVKNVSVALGELIQEAKGYKDFKPFDHATSFSKITGTNLDAIFVSTLELTFNNLESTPLKQCLAYCSIFPKGSVMEKEKLIHLWMAQGFLGSSSKGKDSNKEDIGNSYFQALLETSFLQAVEMDEIGDPTHCKMDDLVHDLAQSVSRLETLILDENSNNEDGNCEIRHLSFCRGGDMNGSVLEECFGKLRTLFCKVDVHNWSLKFRSLRALDLSGSDIRCLPESVGEMIHLRYLDISDTKLVELPEFITRLYHLETLKVFKCKWLYAFPLGMGKLVNLRHIYFTPNPLRQPAEIGHLTDLQTLASFVVGQEKGFRIEELGSMNELRGALRICNLENVTQVEEAKRANLVGKTSIQKLSLVWKLWRNQGEVYQSKDGEIVECLQPPSSLKSLTISSFEGWTPPSWIVHLRNLEELELRDSQRCEVLPALGDLPRLRILRIFGMQRVKCLGSEFYGTSSSPFPSLKELALEAMTCLKEWKEADANAVFSCLEKLKIKGCLSLATAPTHFPSMKELELEGIVSSNPFHQICTNLTTLISVSIDRVVELKELPVGILQNNKNLARLTLHSCDQLMCLGHNWTTQIQTVEICTCPRLCCIQGLTVLDSLSLRFCLNLTALPILEGLSLTTFRDLNIVGCKRLTNLPSGIQSCASLESLSIYMCPNLTMSSDIDHVSVKDLTCLQCLTIHGCDKMTSLPEGLECLTRLKMLSVGEFCRELEEFPSLRSVQHIMSLEKLAIYGSAMYRLRNLPSDLQNLTWIQELHISDFHGMEALPDCIGSLSNLRSLVIEGCYELKYLPSVESMRRLGKLKKLTVRFCSRMAERCVKDSGAEWHKISHIPEIHIS